MSNTNMSKASDHVITCKNGKKDI